MAALVEANNLLAKLKDRNLSFPDRCELALSLLKQTTKSENWLFPRKNQFLFDWLTGSLLKLARSESPRPEIFLNKHVWELFQAFSNILKEEPKESSLGLKRRLLVSDDEIFFDYTRSFDSHVFVIKCALLTIFQVSLSLIATKSEFESNSCDLNSEDAVDPEILCSVILAFVQQNRVSLPVSFTQVTEFIRTLTLSQSKLSGASYVSVLRPTLIILSEIVLGGGANYKKTYPLLVKFCLDSAGGSSLADNAYKSKREVEEKEIWIEFMEKCLFPPEYLEELLALLTSPLMVKALNSDPSIKLIESIFPKSSTFQKTLFIDLASKETKSVDSCHVVFEAFLRAAGGRITRESGFNFFTFLIRRTISPSSSISSTIYFTKLAQLISILQARGNEIYQQRNDEIYRNQSGVIEEIFASALAGASSPFPLFLALARLNYYLVSDRLNLILSRLNSEIKLNKDLIEFVVGMFELAALANQLPVLLETILKSELLPLSVTLDQSFQSALSRIFRTNLSPISLHQIYLTLIKPILNEEKTSKLCVVLLMPVIRSITRIIDSVESFDKIVFSNLQRQLLSSSESEALNLLAFIVRWTPGTFLLSEDLFTAFPQNSSIDYHVLNLLFALKCKDSTRVSCKAKLVDFPSELNELVLKYLPVVADDMEISALKSFSVWLLENESICLKTLKIIKFFEISSLQAPFLDQLLVKIEKCEKFDFVLKVIKLIPWEYLSDEIVLKLIKSLWKCPEAVGCLISLPSPFNIRKVAIKKLVVGDLKLFVDFLMVCATENDLLSKCLQVEHSSALIREILDRSRPQSSLLQIQLVAKMLKFSDFKSSELISFIEDVINPSKLMRERNEIVSVEFLDALDVILEWVINYKIELVASCILALPDNSIDNLEISVRSQALRCKFPARTDIEFINESVNLASKLSGKDSPVALTFKKDFLSLLKEIPSDFRIKELLESFLLNSSCSGDSETIWKFGLGLQAINQLIHVSNHVPLLFSIFTDNLEVIYNLSLKFELIPGFLVALKSIVQLKKNVTWKAQGVSIILGVLRKARQAHPQCFDEIFTTLRLIISLHLRHFKSLLPLFVSNVCESFEGISSLEESIGLGRIISELGSLRRGDVEAFALFPILNTFISTKFNSPVFKKLLQLAMNNLMYHLGTRKQLLQLLSTALVVEHEHRVILKSFIDEYNKFHKYIGRA